MKTSTRVAPKFFSGRGPSPPPSAPQINRTFSKGCVRPFLDSTIFFPPTQSKPLPPCLLTKWVLGELEGEPWAPMSMSGCSSEDSFCEAHHPQQCYRVGDTHANVRCTASRLFLPRIKPWHFLLLESGGFFIAVVVFCNTTCISSAR